MANISITTVCHRDCGYCFARDAWNGAVRHMTIEDYQRALDFLARSGIDQARLLGGEPTLNPHFPRMVDLALARGLRVLVFTGGLMPEAALQRLEQAPADRVAVLVNVNGDEPGQAHALQRLGRRAVLGFNIHTPAFEPDFLLDLIRQHGLTPSIRFGLAHPSVDGSNRFLHPRHYAAAGERLARFAERARAAGIGLELDCGFVPCMFPPEAWEWIGPGAGCAPIPDILPDLTLVACYPLAALGREPLENGRGAGDVRGRFDALFAVYRPAGVFRACSGCALRESGRCEGGCLAAAMLRLRRGPFEFSVAEERLHEQRTEASRSARQGQPAGFHQ
ncbi:MAG: radical SAM protein [Acidobacteriota bacterium]